jgi:LysR family nitrogen assimilation transcriptional regulator
MMDLRSLRYFVQISEQRSFTKAARRLNVAQPSLTRQIHNLEQDLGVTLFVRLSRGVALTESGELLLDHAVRLLRDTERTKALLHEQNMNPSGQVLFGLPPTLGPVILPQLITQLRRQYPKIALEVVPSRNITLVDWVLTGRIDIAVIAKPDFDPELLITEIGHEEMVLLTGPGRRNTKGKKEAFISAEELKATPLIGSESLLAITSTLLKPSGVRLHVDFVLNNLEAIRKMVQQAMCYTVFPYSAVREDHEAGRFDAYRILKEGLYRRLVIATSANRRLTAATQVVKQFTEAIITEVEVTKGFVLKKFK